MGRAVPGSKASDSPMAPVMDPDVASASWDEVTDGPRVDSTAPESSGWEGGVPKIH